MIWDYFMYRFVAYFQNLFFFFDFCYHSGFAWILHCATPAHCAALQRLFECMLAGATPLNRLGYESPMSNKTQIGFSHFPFSNALGAAAKPDALLNCLVFIPALIVPFSPFIAFFIGLLLLIVFGSGFQRWHRIFVSVVVIFAGAVLFGDNECKSDCLVYYDTYEKLLKSESRAFFVFGNGIEIASPILFWLVGKTIGHLDPSHFTMALIFVGGLLLYIWLEVYGLKQVVQRQKAICIALVLLFFDFFFAGFLTRQMFSSIMILYAITAQRQESRFLFILLATLFHTTALIFLPIIWLLVRHPKLGIGLCIAICGSYVVFYEIANTLYQTPNSALFEPLRQKLPYYVITQGDREAGLAVRNIILTLFLLICTWVYVDKSQAKWRHIIMGLGIIYLAAAFVNTNLSIRVGLLFFFVALGYFLFLTLRKQPLLLYGFTLLYLANSVENLARKDVVFYNYDIIGPFFYYLY